MSRRYATLTRAAAETGVTYRTFHDYVTKGFFPVYKLPGQAAACVDLDEVEAGLARVRTRKGGKARPNYGSFGPDAIVRDLSAVAEQFEVLS